MFSDNNTSPKRMSTNFMVQQLNDLTSKLESAHQQIRIIRLEKLEYQTEINQLKLQNETLIREKNDYLEIATIERQKTLFLRSLSMNIEDVGSYNNDLNMKLSEYQKLTKQLKSDNINLIKENEKYKIILEQLNEQKEKREEIHINNILNLENKIKNLQNECDELREEINKINTSQKHDDDDIDECLEEKHYGAISPLLPTTNPSIIGGFRLSLKSNTSITKELFAEIGNKSTSYSDNIDIEIVCNDDVINQLIQFGYTENEIIMARNIANDKNDINEIVEIIRNKMDSQYNQYQDEITNKIEEKVEAIINTSKAHINKLRKRIKILQQENHKLILQQKSQ